MEYTVQGDTVLLLLFLAETDNSTSRKTGIAIVPVPSRFHPSLPFTVNFDVFIDAILF